MSADTNGMATAKAEVFAEINPVEMQLASYPILVFLERETCIWSRQCLPVRRHESERFCVLTDFETKGGRFALHTARGRVLARRGPTLERRRCAGADDLTGHRADASETVRASALEIVSIPRTKDPTLVLDRDLQPSGKDDSTFLPLVDQRNLPGVGTGLITFSQHLKISAEHALADLPV
jgi:hypothetical protein